MKRIAVLTIAALLAPLPARAESDDARVAECRKLLKLEDEARRNAAALVTSCDDLRARNADLEKRNAALQRLAKRVDGDERARVGLETASEQELNQTVARLQKALDDCAEEAATPWYGRWELWVGAAVGLAAGVGVGYALGSL